MGAKRMLRVARLMHSVYAYCKAKGLKRLTLKQVVALDETCGSDIKCVKEACHAQQKSIETSKVDLQDEKQKKLLQVVRRRLEYFCKDHKVKLPIDQISERIMHQCGGVETMPHACLCHELQDLAKRLSSAKKQ